jgi:hypothetical protein
MSTIESKVIAATAGSGAGAAVSAFVLWLLGITVWHVPNTADSAGSAISAVPTPVAGLIAIVLAVAGAFLAGYAAPHTDRPTSRVLTMTASGITYPSPIDSQTAAVTPADPEQPAAGVPPPTA